VTVGPSSKFSSNMLQYFLHIHRKVSPILGIDSAALWRIAILRILKAPCAKRRMA
jgi:hypothetical protein